MSAPAVPDLLHSLTTLTSIRDTELLEKSLLQTLLPLLGVAQATLYRCDEQGEIVREIVHSQARGSAEGGAEELTEVRYADIKLAPLIEDLLKQVKLDGQQHSSEGVHAHPLYSSEGLAGYLLFASGQSLSEAQGSVVTGILQVYRNYYALLDESQRDKLTGLLNRHALEHSMFRLQDVLAKRETEKRKPSKQDLCYWAAVIDIDHFKKVNDQFGHVIGDEVLLQAARIMRQCLRGDDLLYRYGGEEFVAITATHGSQEEASQLERMRASIANHVFPQVGQVTISIGYAALNGHFSSNEIIGRADIALYEAKRAGRNQVLSYEMLLRDGRIHAVNYGSAELFGAE